MKSLLTTLLVFACPVAIAAPQAWSVVALHEGPGSDGTQNVLQTALAGPQLVLSLEVYSSEPHAKGAWFLLFSTPGPVSSFGSVTATAYNSDGEAYVWPIAVLNQTAVIENKDGSTTVVLGIDYDGVSTIKAADRVLFSHSDGEIETVLLSDNFDEQFERLEAGIKQNEQGLELDHLLLDSYDRNHEALKALPKGGWPVPDEIERARAYLGITNAEIQAMSWYDIERAVFEKEQQKFDEEQEAFEAEQAASVRRGLHLQSWVESFRFPDADACTEPVVPVSFATAEQAENKTAQINEFADCLQNNVSADIDAFGELITEAGGTLDKNTLQFEFDSSYFVDCDCVEAFVVLRDQFYERNATTLRRWRAFEQSIAHLYEQSAQ